MFPKIAAGVLLTIGTLSVVLAAARLLAAALWGVQPHHSPPQLHFIMLLGGLGVLAMYKHLRGLL